MNALARPFVSAWKAVGARERGMLIALIVLGAGLYASNQDFLGTSNTLTMVRLVSMLGVFAIGLAFVIITGGIDLSVGSVIGLTGVLIAKFSSDAAESFGWSLWVGIPMALAVAMLIGLTQGLLITRFGLQPFIVTLGGMLLLRGVSQTIVKGGTLSLSKSPIRNLVQEGYFYLDDKTPLLPYPLLIFLGVAVVATYVLHFTVFGRYVYAIGGNRDAAAYSGIPVKRVETTAYVISAGLGGVAGILYASYIGQMSQQVGVAFELSAIAACVLGGCSLRGGEGTILGVVIGTMVMRVIDNGIIMFQLPYTDADGIDSTWRLNKDWTNIIIGAVILVAVVLDQVVHMLQARRRTRKAGQAAGLAPPAQPAAVARTP
jgi:ribose transport system permease protein